ncbi:MAG TPA: hypothetical protein VD840_02570 [Sinorhizobium sp.]|nr:hypothetical protein [Sinorhizobium sp.]
MSLEAVAYHAWFLGGTLIMLGLAYWLRRNGYNVLAFLSVLMALLLLINWSGIYP